VKAERTKKAQLASAQSATGNSTRLGSVGVSPGRQAYLKLRAARARRRLILSIILLVFTAATWGDRYIPGFWYPWWYALVPTGLLLAVLVSGRLAARAAKANDLQYARTLKSGQRQANAAPSQVMDDAAATELAGSLGYFNEEPAEPLVNNVIPVPPTQLIPEADQLLAVMENLRDDPEFEADWANSQWAPELIGA